MSCNSKGIAEMSNSLRWFWYCIDSIIAWKSIGIDQKIVKSELKRNRMIKKRFPGVSSR